MQTDLNALLMRFIDLVGPSEIHPGVVQDSAFTARTGLRLPSDYLAWASTFATLELCNELLINNLVSPREHAMTREDFARVNSGLFAMRDVTEERRSVQDAAGREVGSKPWLPIFPEPGGLLPWGNDSNAVSYLWDTSDADPDRWTVVLYDGSWQEFDCGFLTFLVRLLEGTYEGTSMFMDGWPWLPAIEELDSASPDDQRWHTPDRWLPYFHEYDRRSGTLRYDKESMRWTKRFR